MPPAANARAERIAAIEVKPNPVAILSLLKATLVPSQLYSSKGFQV